MSMSCDRVDAFREWMSTVCLCHVTMLMLSGRVSTVCHVTVLMPSGHVCRLCVYVM